MQPVDIWSPIADGAGLGMQLANQQFDMGRAMTMDAVALQEARDRARLVQQRIDEGIREQGYQHAARQFNKNQFRQLMGAGLLPQAQGPGPYDAGAAGGPISMDAAQDDANGHLEQLFGQLDPRQQNLFLEGASRYQQEFRNREMTLSQLESVYGQRDREVQSARGVVGNDAADQALQRNQLFRESATAQVFGVGSGAQAQILRGTMPGGGGLPLTEEQMLAAAQGAAMNQGLSEADPRYQGAIDLGMSYLRQGKPIPASLANDRTQFDRKMEASASRDQWNAELQAINKTLERVNRRRDAAFKEFTKARDAGEITIGQGAYNEKLLPISNLDREIEELEARRDAIIGGRSNRQQQPKATPTELLKQAKAILESEGVSATDNPEYAQQLQAKFRQLRDGSPVR